MTIRMADLFTSIYDTVSQQWNFTPEAITTLAFSVDDNAHFSFQEPEESVTIHFSDGTNVVLLNPNGTVH